MIKGRITLDNKALTGQDILFISKNGKNILGHTQTGEEGMFLFKTGAVEEMPVNLLCKIRKNGLVSIYHLTGDHNQEAHLDIDTSAYYDIMLEISGDAGYPDHLNIFADPVAFDDVPAHFAKYFNMQDKNIASSYFFKKPVSEKRTSLQLRKGVYNIGGEYILSDPPDDRYSYIVTKALLTGNGQELEGNAYNGFRLVVTGHTTVRMILDRMDSNTI